MIGASPAEGPRTPGLLSNRNYEFYLLGNVAGWGAIAIADVLFLYLVFTETGSTLAVAYVGLAEALPPVVVGIPAGVIADRYDRRTVLVVATLLQAAAVGLVLLDLATAGFRLAEVLVLLIVLETVTVVFRPTANSILPSLVRESALEDANGVVQAATAVASTLGAALAAVVVAIAGIFPALALDALLLFVGALLFAAIAGRVLAPGASAPPREPRGLSDEFTAGIAYLRAKPALFQLTVVSVASGFFVEMFSPYLVVYTARILDAPGEAFGFLLAGFSAGFFVGSLLVRRIGILREFGRVFAVAMVMSGGLLSVLVLAPSFGLALGSLTGVGMLLGLVVTGLAVLVQRLVPADLLGRYLGVDETLTWAVAPLGILSGGLLAQAGGVDLAFSIAVLGLIGTGICALVLPELRSLRLDPGDLRVPEGALYHPPGI